MKNAHLLDHGDQSLAEGWHTMLSGTHCKGCTTPQPTSILQHSCFVYLMSATHKSSLPLPWERRARCGSNSSSLTRSQQRAVCGQIPTCGNPTSPGGWQPTEICVPLVEGWYTMLSGTHCSLPRPWEGQCLQRVGATRQMCSQTLGKMILFRILPSFLLPTVSDHFSEVCDPL